MKTKAFTLCILFQLLLATAFAQKNAGLNTLLDKNAEFILPQTTDKISAALRTKAIITDNENDGERYAEWITSSGLGVYTNIGDKKTVNDIWFSIPDDRNIIISGLPFNLVLNKTTIDEAMAKFKKYNVKKSKFSDGSFYSNGTKLLFKKGRHYVTLSYNDQNLLKSLSIMRFIPDPAAG